MEFCETGLTWTPDVAGEFIRQNLVEKEPGVPLALDLAIYDVETCDPITDHWVQIWCKYLLCFSSQ